jgi:hypothetical protein
MSGGNNVVRPSLVYVVRPSLVIQFSYNVVRPSLVSYNVVRPSLVSYNVVRPSLVPV